MRAKDSTGLDVELTISGFGDEAQIDEIWYTDGPISEVPEEEIQWIEKAYAAEIEFEALENAIGAAEDAADRAEDR